MSGVRVLRKQEKQDNGCGTAGCNVLQIVDVEINALAVAQTSNTKSLLMLINEKFDNMEKNNIRESARIDDIRKDDREAVRIANDSTIKRAEQLNTTLIETAETVRKNTDSLASTIATNLAQITTRQDEKIANLERINWTKTGEAGASPTIQSLVADLVNLKNANATNTGVNTGQQLTKTNMITMLGVAISIITIITLVINFFR